MLHMLATLLAGQVQFNADLKVINECLDGLIASAVATRQEDDLEALQARDYAKVAFLSGLCPLRPRHPLHLSICEGITL
jgi:hypothetical protein